MKKRNLKRLRLHKKTITKLTGSKIGGGPIILSKINSLDRECEGSFGTEFTNNGWGGCDGNGGLR